MLVSQAFPRTPNIWTMGICSGVMSEIFTLRSLKGGRSSWVEGEWVRPHRKSACDPCRHVACTVNFHANTIALTRDIALGGRWENCGGRLTAQGGLGLRSSRQYC